MWMYARACMRLFECVSMYVCIYVDVRVWLCDLQLRGDGVERGGGQIKTRLEFIVYILCGCRSPE